MHHICVAYETETDTVCLQTCYRVLGIQDLALPDSDSLTASHTTLLMPSALPAIGKQSGEALTEGDQHCMERPMQQLRLDMGQGYHSTCREMAA